MIETGVLIGRDGTPIFWHLPPGRSSGNLPDSRELWDVIWENRATLYGFAHSHPGNNRPAPSWEDITTFAAIESALGRRLHWWITSSDVLVLVRWVGPGAHDYGVLGDRYEAPWLTELRRLTSYQEESAWNSK